MPQHSSALAQRWRDDAPVPKTILSPKRSGRWPRGPRVCFALTLLLGLLGAIGGVLSWISPAPRPYFLPLVVAEYQAPSVPVLSMGESDLKALRDADLFQRVDARTVTRQDAACIVRELAGLKDLAASDTAVVYLAAHALFDEDGKVMILPADAAPDNPRSWVPFRVVLEHLRDCPARRQLLVVDVMKPVPSVRLGALNLNIAGALPKELDAVPDERRLVLAACAPGQVSHVSEELGRSVFSYYFEAGLRGYAEGYGSAGKRDGQVNLQELAAFLRARVDRWAQRNRGARQTPVLYGAGDFPLLALDHARPRGPVAAARAPVYPPSLLEDWKARDGRWESATFAQEPRLFQQEQAGLLEMERAWRAGCGFERVLEAHGPFLQRVNKSFAQQAALVQPHAVSLAQERALGRKADPAIVALVEDMMCQATKATGKPEPALGARSRLLADFRAKTKDTPEFDLEAAAFAYLIKETVGDASSLRLLEDALRRPGRIYPRYAETLFLRQVVDVNDRVPAKDWPAEKIGLAFKWVAGAEEMEADPVAAPWTGPLLDAAMQARHAALVRLLTPGFAGDEERERLWAQAAEQYRFVAEAQRKFREAHDALDQALALLSLAPAYLEEAPDQGRSFDAVARLTRQLGQALVSAPENADTDPRCRLTARLAEVQRLDKSLRDALGEYTRPFDAANVDRLIARSAAPTAGPIQVHALEGLLASPTPLVSGATRLGLWKARRALAQRLLEQTLRLDHQEDEQKTTTPAPEVYDAESGVRQQQIEALQRNRRTLGVAEAGGMAPERLEAVEAAATRARFEPDDWGHWGKLGALVRRLWNRGTPEEYRRQESLEAKRALAWIASPLDTLPHIDDGEMRIGARIRLQRAIALWSRLGGQYRYFARDFAGLGLESPGLRQSESFYRHAATVNAALVLPEPEAYARLRLLKPLEQLNPTRESVDAVLEVTRELPPGAFPPVEVALRRPDDLFFQASPDAATVPAARRSDAPRTLVTSVPCRIELKPGALAAAAPRPAGLLAAASFAGKTYHRVIAVPLPAIAHDVEILVSSNPKEPDPVLPALRVLPAQASEVFFVYVRNQLAVARKVNIELLVNDLPLSPGKLSLALAAGATLKAPLPDVAPPKEGLPELKGPLQLRVTDAETNRVLQSRTLPIDIAPPREHVEVRDSEYTPTAAVNKTVARRAESSRLESRPAVRIPTPAYAISAPGFGFAVEVDNPPAGATLDIGICRLEDGKLQADDVRRFPTPRQRRIGFWPRGPGGSLLLEAAIDDHHVSFDTSLIRGKRVLRARLLDEGGREILQTLQPILFDATAPSAVRFVDAPARARRGAATKLAVQALDPESGIRAVKFFVGKPQDEKPPRDAAMTTADPTAADPNLWTATLPLPEDGKGPTPITAHVINNAGLARFETVMVDCIDVDPATIGPARLRGKITEGDRPQAGMEVLLLDEMNREKARTRTKADGSYEFDKLEPGRYKVYSLKPETRRRALVPVRIGPNETKTVDLPLAL